MVQHETTKITNFVAKKNFCTFPNSRMQLSTRRYGIVDNIEWLNLSQIRASSLEL